MMLSCSHIKNVLQTLLNDHKKNGVLVKDVAELLVKQAAVQVREIRVLVPCEGFSG